MLLEKIVQVFSDRAIYCQTMHKILYFSWAINMTLSNPYFFPPGCIYLNSETIVIFLFQNWQVCSSLSMSYVSELLGQILQSDFFQMLHKSQSTKVGSVIKFIEIYLRKRFFYIVLYVPSHHLFILKAFSNLFLDSTSRWMAAFETKLVIFIGPLTDVLIAEGICK